MAWLSFFSIRTVEWMECTALLYCEITFVVACTRAIGWYCLSFRPGGGDRNKGTRPGRRKRPTVQPATKKNVIDPNELRLYRPA